MTESDIQDWGTHYPPEIVRLGYELYAASGFSVIPDPEYIASLDVHWIADLNFVARLVRFHDPDNPTPFSI